MTTPMGKNTMDGTKMMGFVARIESEQKAKQVHAENITAIYAEAKSNGLLPAGLRAVVKARSLKPSIFRESEDLRDVYFHAAGLADEPPLFRQIEALASDDMSRAKIIESMKKLVPPNGAIIVELEGSAVQIRRDADGKVTEADWSPAPAVQRSPTGSPMPERPTAEVPNCSPSEAERLGAKAFDDDEPITANPFPFGDKRQPRWDSGWRKQSGNDGMGPET